uniref:Uncharacterized protein n=1 Tax=Rhabditophanes sp. KR3021 TaxID=114890 RepID=A0AC35UEA6_9BILA
MSHTLSSSHMLIRPSMTYAAQTWILNITVMDGLAKTERSILRRIFGIRRWDEERQANMHNEEPYRLTTVTPLPLFLARLQTKYIGHQLRKDDSWQRAMLLWSNKNKKKCGRPRDRLMGALFTKFGVKTIVEMSKDRLMWRTLPQLL